MKKKSYSTTTTAVCSDCNGEGNIVIKGEHQGHGHYAPDTTETCGTCEGSGLVTIKKDTVVTITAKRTNLHLNSI
jgi:DnaJ-class molecular chaperone